MQKEKASALRKKKFFTEISQTFLALYPEITSGRISRKHLALLEHKDNIFADIDFRYTPGELHIRQLSEQLFKRVRFDICQKFINSV